MATIFFTVHGDPQALKRHRSFRRGKFIGQYDPSKGDKSDFLAKAMQHKPDVPFDEPLQVVISAYFARPKSHYGTGRNATTLKPDKSEWHTTKPDRDNIDKFVLDALSGIFWKDDNCICAGGVFKRYTETTPRVVIKISTLNDFSERD